MSSPLPGSTPLLIVISAPSGGGKTTLCDLLVAARSDLSALSRASKSTPVAGSFSAAAARDAVHRDDGPPGDDAQLLDAERSLIEFNLRVLANMVVASRS